MITIEDEGGVRVLTLDRPERRNALTPAGLDALAEAVEACPAPVAYLRGAGPAFCAGADLAAVAAVAEPDADADTDAVEPFIRRGQRVANAIEESPAVVIAGIDGAVRGGGVELAVACDLRLATPAATFGEPGVTFGLFGAWGGTIRLPEVVGLGDALDLSLSGRVIDSEEALRIGLVSRVLEEPRTVAERIADNDPTAMELLKERLRDRREKPLREDAELAAFETLVEEHAERLREFGE
ncbi:enoyl-CoA hydratase/isomerase family protein [Natronomonas sp.]|uniref:enoyl-CoA hydratase/isomerase family protein n=1 Tax=Natronomonas sp. TaxID=2184060 RepID=UPI0026164018|nr:enoyl-CoA hydratase/isomerase family protein [Natronomonas sp.]